MHTYISSMLSVDVQTGPLRTSTAVILLVIMLFFYMFSDHNRVLLDYVAAILAGILVSWSALVRDIASWVPNKLTGAAAEQNIAGNGVYWAIVVVIMAGASFFYLRGRKRKSDTPNKKRSFADKIALVVIFLMAALLAGSSLGVSVVENVNSIFS